MYAHKNVKKTKNNKNNKNAILWFQEEFNAKKSPLSEYCEFMGIFQVKKIEGRKYIGLDVFFSYKFKFWSQKVLYPAKPLP